MAELGTADAVFSGFQNVSRVIVSPNYVNDSTVFVLGEECIGLPMQTRFPLPFCFKISAFQLARITLTTLCRIWLFPPIMLAIMHSLRDGPGLFRFLNASASVVSWQRVDNALVSESFSGGSGYYPPFALSPAPQPTRRSLWNRIIAVLSRYIEALMPSQ